MLEPNIKQQLTGYLERLRHPVELVATLGLNEDSRSMGLLVEDVRSCSPLVGIREAAGSPLVPSFGIAVPGEEPRIRFAGLPMGHEFTSLVLALLQVGGHPAKVSDELAAQVQALPGPLHFEVFISLSCHNCPDVVQALNLMAVLNPAVTCTTIDGSLFRNEVEQREIMAVPTVFLNGEHFSSGRQSLEEFVAKLDTGRAAREAGRLNAKEAYDVLVVGGGPAGAAAAVYAARKGIRTGILAERLGGQTNDTLGIENYISVMETTGPRFAADLAQQVTHYGVDLMLLQKAARLVPASSPGGLLEVHTESGAVLKAKTVVLSTGARWRNVNVPGEAEYRNKGVAYCPHCDGPLFKGKRTAVIGGGNSGVEAAIDLAGIAAHVTILEYGQDLKADAVLVRKLFSLSNVTVLTQAQTTEIVGDGSRVTGLQVMDRATGELRKLDLEGVFVQIGLVPNTEFLRDTLELNPHGEIVVDARGGTDLPGVFAAGDATTVPFKQIVIAAGDGAKAALSAFDHLMRTSLAA